MSDGKKISIEAQISEVEFQLKNQRHNNKASMRGLIEMHESRLRHVLGTLRWIEDNRALLIEVNKRLSVKPNAALAPVAGIGPTSNGHDEAV
jgi:hypothetical protein